ncbi:MAG: 2-amino-4-hydroxy-6-hydroxymethyldihydropteridine diphosphokinase [Methylophaga sp.]|nr:MAG: 2-amino-4-hydroxy-6-hydroxymethyldihydropteridine diphosphokinase [Methylophaga sp.]
MNGIFIGLGSNLAAPIKQVLMAIKALHALPETKLIKQSSLYASPPMGPQDQPDYINAVVELTSQLSASELLDQLQTIEQQQGRVKLRHWGERTLDLDILVYGDQEINDERLTIPHPGLTERAFVLYPLAEITPDLIIPKLGNVASLVQNCPRAGLNRINLDLL